MAATGYFARRGGRAAALARICDAMCAQTLPLRNKDVAPDWQVHRLRPGFPLGGLAGPARPGTRDGWRADEAGEVPAGPGPPAVRPRGAAVLRHDLAAQLAPGAAAPGDL